MLARVLAEIKGENYLVIAGCGSAASDGSAALVVSGAFTSFPFFTVFAVLIFTAFACFGLD